MINTIITIAAVISALGVICGCFLVIHKILKRFEKIEEDCKKQEDINPIIIEGLWACLDGLHQTGANGVVTKTLEKLKKYVINN